MNVLAFESDAAQIEAIRHTACDLVGARLTVATSIQQVLHAVREATPDLILLPALMSPAQETALFDTLRSLPNASHVETLITPMLPPREEPLIVTPGWRRWTSRRPSIAPTVSAESSAFAERMHWALERARERKRHHAAAVEMEIPLAVPAAAASAEFALVAADSPHCTAAAADNLALSLEAANMAALETSQSLVELLQGLDGQAVSPGLEELELADVTSRLLKKLNQSKGSDRRQHRRFAAADLPGLRSARIKFGPNVALVDVSAGGALIETDARLQPETEALLELVGSSGEAVVPFRVVRCQIAALNGAPKYLGACAFKQPLDLDDPAWRAGLPGVVATEGLEARAALTLVSSRVVVRNAW